MYDYPDALDREIVALIASSLAFGNVRQILRSASTVLHVLGPSPRDYLSTTNARRLKRKLDGFKHRWTTSEDMVSFLLAIGKVIREFGSMEACFASGWDKSNGSIIDALQGFVDEFHSRDGGGGGLLPSPSKGSACKRLNLFLRWMARHDDVDPGGWDGVPAGALIVPLDTHMHCLGLSLRLTSRKQADMKTAVQMTEAFRKFSPEDPVRYDFCLTRLGIHNDGDMGAFLAGCGAEMVRP